MRKNYKPLIIGILCTLVVVMAVGFALLSQELTISGTSSINSNWNIRITNIRVKNITSAYATGTNASADVSGSTGCTTQTAPCDSTEANFEAKLITPGDSITYEVTVTNSGNLDGVVESIDLTCSENEAITCTKSGLDVADTISKNNGTNTVEVKVEYNSATTTQPASTTSNIQLTINYQQDLGQVTPVYPTYSVGDTIQNYKGSNWRVIKNSTSSEDYVTLMKETALSANEIGNSYSYKYKCNSYDAYRNDMGCTTPGELVAQPSMAYYWSSTCHYDGTYGTYGLDTYDSEDTSGCSGHTDYVGSKIKEVVDNYMTTNNMTNDLKGVDGYKIRLITKDELMTNLGYVEETIISAGNEQTAYNAVNVPTWVYQNFGTDLSAYWTMTPYANDASKGWIVDSGGNLFNDVVNDFSYGVRPVINLLKSNIPAQS